MSKQKSDILLECIASILLRTNRLTQVNRCISGAAKLSNSIVAFLVQAIQAYFEKNSEAPLSQLSMPLKPSIIGDFFFSNQQGIAFFLPFYSNFSESINGNDLICFEIMQL